MNKLVLVFLIFPFLLISQNEKEIDSLTQLIQREKSDSIKYSLLIKKALLFEKSSQIDSALNIINNVINTTDKGTVSYTTVRGYLVLGNIYLNQYKYDLAFKNYSIADSLCNSAVDLKESSIHAQALNFLGYAVRLTHDYDKSTEFYLKSKDIYTKINDEKGKHEVNIGLAQSFISKGEYNEALSLLNDAVKYNKENNTGNPYSYAVICRGYLLVKMKRFEAAEGDYLTYYNLANQSSNITKQLRALSYLGYFYSQKGDLSKAEEYYLEGVEMGKKEQNLFMVEETQRGLIDVLKKSNNLEALSRVYEEYLETKEKQDSITKSSEIYELETKYQTTQKEQEIALLNADNKLSEQRRKTQKFIYLGIVVFLLLMGVALYYAYKNKQKTASKLKELNTLKSQFLANISHEFRTPLTLIKSPIQHLQKIDDKDVKKQLALIDRNADTMLDLVNQLLELSRIEGGHLVVQLKESNLSTFINTLLEPFQFKAKKENIDFQVTVNETAEKHYFDANILSKIISNLVVNAFKYGEQGTPVKFNSLVEGEFLKIQVSNNNKSLNKSDLEKIFERFYQNNSVTPGFGVGLSLVKDLVTLLEGSVYVTTKNHEVCFTVKIPIHERIKNAVVIKTDAIDVLEINNGYNSEFKVDTNPILLLIDDNTDVLHVLTEIFEKSYDIIKASNGVDGLKFAQEKIPDVIICDVMMPKMDGFELTSKIKSHKLTSHIPIILLTAKTTDQAHLKGIESAADAFITKPFNHDILETKVAQLLEERKRLQERYSKELILRPIDITVNSADEQFITALEKVIEHYFTNPDFSTEEFAKRMNVSRMQLHRKLKSLFGVSATEFIRNERLKAAAVLLQNPKLSIADVAYNSGFNEVTYFSKCFKTQFGVTPSVFKKNN